MIQYYKKELSTHKTFYQVDKNETLLISIYNNGKFVMKVLPEPEKESLVAMAEFNAKPIHQIEFLDVFEIAMERFSKFAEITDNELEKLALFLKTQNK